jgi:hypothetical protein
MSPRLEVIADHHAVKTDLLGVDTEIEQFERPELLG